MPDISGIDVAALLPKETLVIFTTAYSDYAVKGFELDALDYLIKPFNLGRFLKACQKARESFELQPKDKLNYLFIKTGDGQIRVDFKDLLFCEATGNYVSFQLKEEKHLSCMTFGEVEKLLPSFFVRTHRSFLGNSRLITKVERHQLHMGNRVIPVSSTFLDLVMERIGK